MTTTIDMRTSRRNVLLLAKSLAQRVHSIASHNPDIHPAHFIGVKDQAARLHDATQAAVNGTGSVQEVVRLAQAVTSWFTRTHPRASGKVLEGTGAALDEAERILDGIAELEPALAGAGA